MRDFTLKTYKKLLIELQQAGYGFVTFAEYVQSPDEKKKTIILRHDVDQKPLRSLRTAEIENGLGIKGTYYFRVIDDNLPKEAIERTVRLGHEIGYHYNVLKTVGGNVERALDLFQKNLAKLRESAPVRTACMHGSPLSRHDNRDLWKDYDYHKFGIIGEPYFDINFYEVMYLTDTGRRWDGERVSIRDKVRGQRSEVRGERSEVRGQRADFERIKIHSTQDIISALKNDLLPEKIMLTVHPQRWTDEWLPWFGELVGQKVKNVVKYFIVRANC